MELLANFCAFNNMIIGGSILPYKNVNKAIWHMSQDTRSTMSSLGKTLDGRYRT